jgi:hypothetical protein
MAKNAGRLAGLAALAGAAYMMTRGKGKSDDAGEQTTSSYTKDTKKVGSDGVPLKTQAQSIAEADKSVGSGPSPSSQQPSGVLTQGTDKSAVDLNANRNQPAKLASAPASVVNPAPVPKLVSQPSDKRVALSSDAAVLEALNSRGNRSVKNDNYSNEGRSNILAAKKKQIPVLPLGSSDTKTYDRKQGATAGGINAYRKEQEEKERINKLQASGGRRASGGAIKTKKMASGGMTSKVSSASSRADGIATRGKTKCKMY